MKKKIFKWLLYCMLIFLALLVILYFAIQMPSVQNYAKDKILSSLSERYNAEWHIGDIKVNFFDEVIANDIVFLDQQKDTLLSANRLLVDISLFSLLGKKINIDEVNIEGLRSKIYEMEDSKMNFNFLIPKPQNSVNQENPIKSEEGWMFSIDEVNFNKPSIFYKTSSQRIEVVLEDLSVDINALDLNNQKVDLSLLQLNNGTINIENFASKEFDSPFEMPQLGWDIQLEKLDVKGSNFNMVSESPLIISDISIVVSDTKYSDGQLELDIEQIKATIPDQITLKNISGEIIVKGSDLNCKNLILTTSEDMLQADVLKYNIKTQRILTEQIKANVSSTTLSKLRPYIPKDLVLLKNTKVNLEAAYLMYSGDSLESQGIVLNYGKALDLKTNLSLGNLRQQNIKISGDISRFKTDLALLDKMLVYFSVPDSLSQFRKLEIRGAVSGSLAQLKLNKFNINLDDVFSTKISGSLRHIEDLDKLQIDTRFQNLIADIKQLPIPRNNDIALDSLGKIGFDGSVVGNLNAMTINGSIHTDIGDLVTDIQLSNLDNIENLAYQGTLSMKKFDLGVLLRNSDLHKITITTELDGKGLDFDKLDTMIKGRISDFAYNGYDYADLYINAKISDSKINGQLSIDDENIKLSYDGIISFLDGQSIYQFEAIIDTLNLEALGFYNKEVSFSGKLISDFKLPLRQESDGYLDIYKFRISNPNESFFEDSLQMMAAKRSDSTFIDIRSDFMSFDIDGQYGVRDLPKAIMSFADHYMNLDTSTVVSEKLSQSARIKGQLKTLLPLDVIIVDKLIQARNISFDMNFDFDSHDGDGQLVADSLYYDKYFSERMTLNMLTESDVLAVNVLGENNLANGIEVTVFRLDNELRDRKLYSTVLVKDDDALPKLKFSTIIENTDDAILLSLNDSLVLNRKNWIANKNNLVKLSDGRISINELSLTDQNEYLKIYSTDEVGNNLAIEFKNFNIGQFSTLLTNEPSKLSGNIDGEIEIRDITTDMYYLINAVVADIVYDSTSVGALTIMANDNPNTNIVTADLRLKGPQNDLIGKGTYNTNSKVSDFQLDIDNFQLMLLDPFLSEIMKDSRGSLSGNVTLKGKIDEPKIDGLVTLDKAITTVVINNARYAIDNHTFKFNNDAIDIGAIDLYDARNNAVTISGKIYHNFLDDFHLDLELYTDKFLFLNTTKEDNPIFYGKLVLDASGTIKGPLSLLDVNLKARTLENTLVTLSPLSGSSFAIEEAFITYGKPDHNENQTSEYLLKLARAFPFKVNLLLNATDQATINFILDPVAGDRIVSKGKGDLRITLNPDGKQEIYGIYTVNDGSYSFSYGDFVSKEFKIKPGGTIRFNGDPLGAVLDIDAIYNVYTTTYELIKNEVSIDDSEIEAAQKRTNVEVYLSLEGSLSSPKVNLDIQIPDLQSSTLFSTIDRKLNELRNDPNELNSQVFGLLIFNGFLSSNKASEGFGSLGSNYALKSISNLISSQLNKFADKAIKGVDINVNVNSYESNYSNGGNVTEIGLEVSKRLFNNRLKVSADGSLDLADNGGAESYSSFIGDFVLEYKLTENGNYSVRIFSKSNFDRIANENTNKNGVSLFFNKSFDSKTGSK